jgi:hypothetical protein
LQGKYWVPGENENTKRLKIWNDELDIAIKGKKEQYLKYLQNQDKKADYNKACAVANKLVRKANREAWDQYVSTLEHDIYGRQNFVYKVIKHLNKEEKRHSKHTGDKRRRMVFLFQKLIHK